MKDPGKGRAVRRTDGKTIAGGQATSTRGCETPIVDTRVTLLSKLGEQIPGRSGAPDQTAQQSTRTAAAPDE